MHRMDGCTYRTYCIVGTPIFRLLVCFLSFFFPYPTLLYSHEEAVRGVGMYPECRVDAGVRAGSSHRVVM